MPAALVALMSGQITLAFGPVVGSTQLANSGKVIPLGVAGTGRVPSMPQVPTFSEQGFPEFTDFSNYLGLALSHYLHQRQRSDHGKRGGKISAFGG